jgi:hypothetical protein
MTAHGFRAMAATLLNEMGPVEPRRDREAACPSGNVIGPPCLYARRVLGRAGRHDAALVGLPGRSCAMPRRSDDP